MKKELNNIQVVWRMLALVKPLTLPMSFAVIMGVLGFICAIGIPVLSVMALLQIAGMYPPYRYVYVVNLFTWYGSVKGASSLC